MVNFFDHVCLPGSSAHIFIEAEGLGTSALPCTMQLETGDRRTGHAERRGNHSPDCFSYRFYFSQEKNLMPRFVCGALTTKHLFRIQTCWGLCWCNFAFFSSSDYFGTPCGFSKHPQHLPGLRLASDAAS